MTVVTIAHRLSMISFADSVVALERGVVMEAGEYRSLIERDGSRLSHMAAGERAGRTATG